MRVGELSEIAEKGVEQKRGEEKQIFEKGRQAGSRGRSLKKGGGLEPPCKL